MTKRKEKVNVKKQSKVVKSSSTKSISEKKVGKKKIITKKVSHSHTNIETKAKKPTKKQEQKTLLLFCPRCKRETDNVITGFIGQKIRRVRCEVCKSEYNYHRIQALKKRMDEEKSLEYDEDRVQQMQQHYYRIWEDLMLGRDPESARVYNIKEKYFENDLINHPVFGIGVVRAILEDYKIEVVFKNGIKILAHNRFLSKKS